MIASFITYWSFGYPIESDNPHEYRFGINGMEKDPEITGQEGNHHTAAFWEYDSRIGRRLNVDPVVKPWESSYLAFSGNPYGDRGVYIQMYRRFCDQVPSMYEREILDIKRYILYDDKNMVR